MAGASTLPINLIVTYLLQSFFVQNVQSVRQWLKSCMGEVG
jgi:hypothetical protein